MAYPNYSDTNLNPLILNYVPDQVTFDQMENDDRIEEDQLYLIPEDDEQVAGTFFAEYDVTTWDEVVEAIEAGKNIIAVYNYDNSNYYLPLTSYATNNYIAFEILHDGTDFWVVLNTDNEWHSGSYSIGGSSSTNLSDTISSSLNASQGTAATPNAVYSALANITATGDVTGSMNTTSWNIATTVANNAITSNKIATNAINNFHIANFSISSTKLENPSMNIAGSIVALGGSINAATLSRNIVGSNAIGSNSQPIYWNGSSFANASEVFIAEYNVTSFNAITEALEAGKIIKVAFPYDDAIFYVDLAIANPDNYCFISFTKTNVFNQISVTNQNVWSSYLRSYISGNHSSVGTEYGVGSNSNYGHVQLSDSINSTSNVSNGIAATPNAVKTAYDLAVSALNASNISSGTLAIERGGTGANSAANAMKNFLGTNAIGNSSTPVYWNGSAFVNASNIVDEKVKSVALNGENSSKSLLLSPYLGGTYTDTAYSSNSLYWNDYGQSLTIHSRSNDTYLNLRPTSVGFYKNLTVGGVLSTVDLTAQRSYHLPDASGTIALTSSPNFSGTPTAPTAAAGTNTTQIATTAFVTTAIAQASRIQTALNPLLTASNGAWNWSISAMNINNPADIIISVYEKSTGLQVYPDITVNQSSGAISISINDTQSNVALAANTYKAVIIG